MWSHLIAKEVEDAVCNHVAVPSRNPETDYERKKKYIFTDGEVEVSVPLPLSPISGFSSVTII